MQRVPANERGGRVHTSSVTVAVLEGHKKQDVEYSEGDFRVEWFSGTGKGGQHRNKHQNSCRLFHIKSGIVESRQGRKRQSNYNEAMQAIIRRLNNDAQSQSEHQSNITRQAQVGSGMRGDKVRTYRFQQGQVTDHLTNKTARTSAVMKGRFDLLWR